MHLEAYMNVDKGVLYKKRKEIRKYASSEKLPCILSKSVKTSEFTRYKQ